ncbi:hypothetical protein Mal4_55010 [Maioricimonas rarisocia]|uniref:DUF3299 domain-containing protein n=1 Tax=Maioricimonas rarisocia TaxID=2528026 RepID=A0A517ZF90_9PLAN|nr:hypothetical protein [Maioricimonas rarisocia]QDU41136.1 hypothetical protein Mal4_55010 [Maioricimonas rarisocia]
MRRFRVPEVSCLCVLGLMSISGCSTGDDAEYRTYEAVTQTETGIGEEPAHAEADAADEDAESAGDVTTPTEPAAVDPIDGTSGEPAPVMEQPVETPEPAAPVEAPMPDSVATDDGSPPETPTTSNGGNSPMPEPVVEPRTAAPGERVVESGDAPAETETPKKQEGGVKLLVPEREFQTEGPEGALRVSFDDLDLLKVLNMDPVTADAPNLLPDWMRELDGKRIRLRGFMYPPPLEKGLPGFVLARDNQICCFGRNPKPYDILPVQMRSGVTTDYIQGRPFDVVGVFHLRPDIEDGDVYQLYEIDDAIVIDN